MLATCAIIGFSGIVTAVPGYELLLSGLERISGGNPYLFAFICVAVIAAVSGSATGGVQFVLDSFSDKLLAMAAIPPPWSGSSAPPPAPLTPCPTTVQWSSPSTPATSPTGRATSMWR